MKIHKARVEKAALVAKTQWGPRLVVNAQLISDNSKIALWSTQLNNSIYLALKPKEIIEVIENAGKFSLLDRSEETITMSRPSSNGSEGSYYTYNSSNNLESELSLPTPLTEVDKKKLARLVTERAKLLSFCIKIADTQLKEDGYDFNEISIKSLGVTLFINIQSFLPK